MGSRVPSLPGCIKARAKQNRMPSRNIKEAIDGYIAALEEDNLPVPEEGFDALLLAV